MPHLGFSILGFPVATLLIDFIHSASAIGRPTWTVHKEFEIATLADFLCCCWIWTVQSLLPSSLLEFESLLRYTLPDHALYCKQYTNGRGMLGFA